MAHQIMQRILRLGASFGKATSSALSFLLQKDLYVQYCDSWFGI